MCPAVRSPGPQPLLPAGCLPTDVCTSHFQGRCNRHSGGQLPWRGGRSPTSWKARVPLPLGGNQGSETGRVARGKDPKEETVGVHVTGCSQITGLDTETQAEPHFPSEWESCQYCLAVSALPSTGLGLWLKFKAFRTCKVSSFTSQAAFLQKPLRMRSTKARE